MTLNLLIPEIKDPYMRENLRRIKAEINSLQGEIATVATTGGGSSGGGGAPPSEVWTAASSVIVSGGTLTIDTVEISQFKAIKYIVTVYNDANLVNRSFEMKVVNKFSSVDDQVFGTLGSSISFSTQVVLVGSDMNLNLTNNAAYDLTAKFARLIL